MSREVTYDEYAEWCDFLAKNHPQLNSRLPNQILVNGSITAFPPRTMSDEDYDTYKRILRKWYAGKGIIEDYRDEIRVFLPEPKVAKVIYVDSIRDISPVTLDSCKIKYQDDDHEETAEITVNESAEEIRKRAYILD